MSNQNKNTKIITVTRMQQDGFSHLLIPVGAVVILVLAGIAGLVMHANNKTTDKSVNSTSAQTTKSKTSSNTQPKSTLSTTTPSTSSSSHTTTSSSGSSSSTKSSTTTTAPSSTSSAPAAAAQTPLSALTTVITNLDNGVSTQVTKANVTIPGPITNAQGRPIVFSVNGQTYFAYTQEQRPNFSTTPAQTANTMAIVNATGSPALVSAYLDKSGILVDANQDAVGYSTGGD